MTKIVINKYFECFPDNLEIKDGIAKGVKGVEDMEKAIEMDKSVRNLKVEPSLCGDTFWKSEIASISTKLDGDSGIV